MRALALLLLASCASGPSTRGPVVRPIDEDQLALLPAGADAVLDVDMEQLRTWAPARRFYALLPAGARDSLEAMGVNPWLDLDGIVLAMYGLGTAQTATAMLLRGDLDAEKMARGLGAIGGAYRDMKLWESSERAVAKLSPRMLALGSPVDVRRVVDLVRGQGESLRSADRALVTAFARAPSAKSGRPAVVAAAVPSLAMRDRLNADQLPGAQYEWLSFVLAVGDGFDFLTIGKTRSPTEAQSLATAARASLDQLRGRTAVKLLGLGPYLSDIVLVDRGDEVRMVYRLAGRRVDHMLARLEQIQGAGEKKP
jgi:hypothetical protein